MLIAAVAPGVGEDLWRLALDHQAVHRFSTLFTAQNVRDYLSDDKGIEEAIRWCKDTGITKVYLETFRNGYRADSATLRNAKGRFEKAGLETAGCVTTTQIGKISTGWKIISCYTNRKTQEELKSIFEYTAGLFDLIMIDDFWFTDCTCQECDAARRAMTVTMGERTYPVPSDSWEDYRLELMVQLSRSHVLAAAKRVNPEAKLIIKYPQWYDRFHERGYDVIRQSQDFDWIWVGTETRDRDQRSGKLQYEAYFIMRWLGGIGGPKAGGGWYDPLWTTEKTYVEQARQTVLAGARESMLFCYGALQENFGPADIAALRKEIPELLRVAAEVRRRTPQGIAAYKPPNSPPEEEAYVYDAVGMLGLPLAPCHEFPVDAPAAFFPVHALADAELAPRLEKFVASGRPVLLTDGLARRLAGKLRLDRDNIRVLKVNGKPESLLQMPQKELDAMRARMLKPFGVTLSAPAEVALYLFQDGSWVMENFRDREVEVEWNGAKRKIGARGWRYEWR